MAGSGDGAGRWAEGTVLVPVGGDETGPGGDRKGESGEIWGKICRQNSCVLLVGFAFTVAMRERLLHPFNR